MSHVDDTVTANDVMLADELRAAIDDARARITALLEPACPTPTFLHALGDELVRAVGDPASVPYPELADPDAYWNASVKPQSASLRSGAVAIVTWLEERIVGVMGAAEEHLSSMVDAAATAAGLDPGGARADLAGQIDERCMALHHLLAEMIEILPSGDPGEASRIGVETDLRARATADVESLKAAYLREAGGDDAHQQFAEQQWSETFADRVSHREALLAGALPWRHMELALVGYERARADIERLVEDAVVRLQAPLLDMRTLLVEQYDERVAETA